MCLATPAISLKINTASGIIDHLNFTGPLVVVLFTEMPNDWGKAGST